MIDLSVDEGDPAQLEAARRAAALLQNLQQQVRNGTAAWHKCLKPVLKEGGLSLGCGGLYSTSNPFSTASTHATACWQAKQQQQQEQGTDVGDQPADVGDQPAAGKRSRSMLRSGGRAGSSMASSMGTSMDAYVNRVLPQTVELMLQDLAMFFYTSETPFARITNPHLRRAFQRIGTQPAQSSQMGV